MKLRIQEYPVIWVIALSALRFLRLLRVYINDNCNCRKPKPGLILQAAEKYSLDLSHSWMVGDRCKDIAAGQAVGLKTIFIDYNYNEPYEGSPADFTVDDMAFVADIILQGNCDEED